MKKFLTVYEISSMSEDELKNVYSHTKKNGRFRCSTLGIYNVNFINFDNGDSVMEWSEEHGEPRILLKPNEKIKDINGEYDCDYEYSLYIKTF
jgi:hypothetical protein